jgi:threonine 3-dehydrogenase
MNILVTGAAGQIGSELVPRLQKSNPQVKVYASDLRFPLGSTWNRVHLDVTDRKKLQQFVKSHKISKIYHLAAILSGKAEEIPQQAFLVNTLGTFNVLEVAREEQLEQVFIPSSIAVFGPSSPKDPTPQETTIFPTSLYGLTKYSGELLEDYYVHKYGLDIRGLRFPGIISYNTEPGGGSTDWAIDVFKQAVLGLPYECFVTANSTLPFLYMEDTLRSIELLMAAPKENLRYSVYNLQGFSANPADFVEEIRKRVPNFSVSYKPDFRQEIVNGWPAVCDDREARKDWNWKPVYGLSQVVSDMLNHLQCEKAA